MLVVIDGACKYDHENSVSLIRKESCIQFVFGKNNGQYDKKFIALHRENNMVLRI